MQEDAYTLAGLVRELDRLAVASGIYGMTVAKSEPGKTSLQVRDQMNRERAGKLIAFRTLLKSAAALAEKI